MISLRNFIDRLPSQLIAANLGCFLQGINKSNQRKEHRKSIIIFSPLLPRQKGEFDSDQQVHRIANVKANREQFHKHVHTVVVDTEVGVLIGGGEVDIAKGEQMKGILDIEEILIAEDIDCHEHDIEVSD